MSYGRVTDYHAYTDDCQSYFTDAGLVEFMLELLQDESQKKREGSLQAILILSKFRTCIHQLQHLELNPHKSTGDFRKLLSKTHKFVIPMVGILRDRNWTDCYYLLRAVTELIKYGKEHRYVDGTQMN